VAERLPKRKPFVPRVIQMGTDDLKKNKERFESTDPSYQLIDLDEARSKGIMPLPYTASP
jgi:hypothetical protein